MKQRFLFEALEDGCLVEDTGAAPQPAPPPMPARARLVLRLVGRHPFRTQPELWRCLNEFDRFRLVDGGELKRWLRELLAMGAVASPDVRKCDVTGNRLPTWVVAEGSTP